MSKARNSSKLKLMGLAMSLSLLTGVLIAEDVNADFVDNPMEYLIVSEDNSVAVEELHQFTLAGQAPAKGVTETGSSVEVNLKENKFSSTLTDYNKVVVEKTVEAKRIAEEKRKKEEEERKKKEEERKAKEREEQKKKAMEEAIRQAEETGINVPVDDAGCRSWIKTYMGYQAVTCTSSAQYIMLNSDIAYTDPKTGLRMVDDTEDKSDPRYCIALGSFYTTTIGQKVDLVMEDGSVIPCVLGDGKADIHTNDTHQYAVANGDVAEFIIDNDVYYTKYDSSGTVNWVDGLAGSIHTIVVWDDYVKY